MLPSLFKTISRLPGKFAFHSSKPLLSWTPHRYHTWFADSTNLPQDNPYDIIYLEKNEIEARIYKVLSNFEKIDLKSFKFTQDLRKDLGLDSLEQTALLTSIEEEFKTVFEDRVFENFTNLEQVVTFLSQDHLIS